MYHSRRKGVCLNIIHEPRKCQGRFQVLCYVFMSMKK